MLRSLRIVLLLCIVSFSASPSLADTAGGLRINAQGTFTDLGIWLYRTLDGKFGFTDATVGTNESLVMPVPKLPPGATVAGVFIKRHQFDSLGYPLHIGVDPVSWREGIWTSSGLTHAPLKVVG